MVAFIMPWCVPEFHFILCKPSAKSTKCIYSTDDDRVPDLFCSCKCLISSHGGCTLCAPLTNLEHGIGDWLLCLSAQAQDDEHVRKWIVPHQVKPTQWDTAQCLTVVKIRKVYAYWLYRELTAPVIWVPVSVSSLICVRSNVLVVTCKKVPNITWFEYHWANL